MGIKFKDLPPISDEEEVRIQKGIADDPDNPELTNEELANMKPFREVFPDLAASIDREIAKRGRPKIDNPKEAVTLRLDPATLRRFKATGKNWRAKMTEVLERAKL